MKSGNYISFFLSHFNIFQYSNDVLLAYSLYTVTLFWKPLNSILFILHRFTLVDMWPHVRGKILSSVWAVS